SSLRQPAARRSRSRPVSTDRRKSVSASRDFRGEPVFTSPENALLPGRIFCGEPVSTSPENALLLGRIFYGEPVSTSPENAPPTWSPFLQRTGFHSAGKCSRLRPDTRPPGAWRSFPLPPSRAE